VYEILEDAGRDGGFFEGSMCSQAIACRSTRLVMIYHLKKCPNNRLFGRILLVEDVAVLSSRFEVWSCVRAEEDL
jgi:hypothetical protein